MAAPQTSEEPVSSSCRRTLTADVVALDQPFFWNRFGAVEPQGMIYALRRDVVHMDDADGLPPSDRPLQAGKVMLRRDKRPRPLVLRMNVGDCLRIDFQNLLNPDVNDIDEEAPHTRAASVHVIGMQLFTINDDGSYVGANPSSVVDPGASIDYVLYGEREGGFLIHSLGAIVGGEGDGGSISAGLFGAVNVEPAGSVWLRSQVTQAELDQAITAKHPETGLPIIDYTKRYTSGPYTGLPIFEMLDGGRIVHSDLTAVITGPSFGNLTNYPYATTGLYPNRTQPFREFTIIFHDEIGAVQAFREFETPQLSFTLHSARDGFAINYGTGGIGAEVLANRFQVGPVWNCVECKYEEFFLSSWSVGDPAMVVDFPANAGHPSGIIGTKPDCMVSTQSPNEVGEDPNFPSRVEGLRNGDPCALVPGPKATKAFFPEDPSNVYHSYLSDHVKFRNIHAGTDDHHVFHLHAHQWLHTPRSDLSSYLDSQTIGQGANFTYEIARGGSGNLNKTVGDSIFHCHFYPHFAQGMWGLWRVHDVLELGTELDETGRPKVGARALPDGEIPRGTPIPAVVPIPTLPMAPYPAPVTISNGQIVREDDAVLMAKYLAGDLWYPGYPFFVPALAGHRPPHPPLDTIHDGGLARHVAKDGTAVSRQDRLSFEKELLTLDVDFIPEAGTVMEQLTMEFHADPDGHPSSTPQGGTGPFLVNGRQEVRGAPFADPCPPGNTLRTYKAADIEIDAVLNKAGWHFPQQRVISLWEDVDDYLSQATTNRKPPEPFFIRARSGECVEFQLTNLLPHTYELDDFQVRTPTDILGQHIHLVKFDVTASDGAANGFNYEDGSFAPEEVRERLCAIRRTNPDCSEPGPEEGPCNFEKVSTECPVPTVHPFFQEHQDKCDPEKENAWLGAQTTVQRWYADPLPIAGTTGTRPLRTVFTHDHFGPSTHQQAGLYGGLIVEDPNTTWVHNETGDPLGGRPDGGPTTWQAVITNESTGEEFREFLLALADFQLAYEPGSRVCPDPEWGFAQPALAINPPGRKLVGPHPLYEKPDPCPESGEDPPCPEAVSADDPGTTSVNYRSEPVALRVRDPQTNDQAPHDPGEPGDLAFAYETRTDRLDPDFNVLPFSPYLPHVPYAPLTKDLRPGDPFTPLIRVYEGDRVVLRNLVGAHEEEHNFTVHAVKWLFEPHRRDSGYRNSQSLGISEWFDFVIPAVPTLDPGEEADFLYKPTAAAEWQWNGAWGLFRVYSEERTGAERLEVLATQNPDARVATKAGFATISQTDASSLGVVGANELAPESPGRIPIGCPPTLPNGETTFRPYDMTAVSAKEVLANDGYGNFGLIYNRRNTTVTYPYPPGGSQSGPLHDPTAIMFVFTNDLVWVTPPGGGPDRPRLKQDVRREPLVLRARAGECIRVTLRNALPASYADQDGWNAVPMIVEDFNANDVAPSKEVGLHPQLVYYDIKNSDGSNAGINPQSFGKQTVAPGERITYFWYAGGFDADHQIEIPIEFGSTGLSSADPIKHANKGAIGALIIEPADATWQEDTIKEDTPLGSVERLTRASATVSHGNTKFREFVLLFQDNVNLRYASGDPVESLIVNEDPTESAQKAVNYRTEPIWFRMGHAPTTPMEETREIQNFHLVLSDTWIGARPETPIFTAPKGHPTRFRLVHPGGHTQAHVFDLHGHIWEELPYVGTTVNGQPSQSLGSNPASEWQGTRGGHGPTNHHEAILKGGAGGKFTAVGDFLYRDYAGWLLDDGIWGLFQVTPLVLSPASPTSPVP
jgi:hypothetical protein